MLVSQIISAKPCSGAIALRFRIAGCDRVMTQHLSLESAHALHHELGKTFDAGAVVVRFPKKKKNKR